MEIRAHSAMSAVPIRMSARCRARLWSRSETRIGTRKSPIVTPRSWAGLRSRRGMLMVKVGVLLARSIPRMGGRESTSGPTPGATSVEVEGADDRDAGGHARRVDRGDRRQDQAEHRGDADGRPRDPAGVRQPAAELQEQAAGAEAGQRAED